MALNKQGIATALKDLFEADTDTLYGSGKLLQYISADPKLYRKAKCDRLRPCRLYISVTPCNTIDVRSQNTDESYEIDLRFIASQSNYTTAINKLDEAYERIKYLINNEMWSGTMLTAYYTDTNAKVINMEPVSGELPPPEDDDTNDITIDADCSATVIVNRWKS